MLLKTVFPLHSRVNTTRCRSKHFTIGYCLLIVFWAVVVYFYLGWNVDVSRAVGWNSSAGNDDNSELERERRIQRLGYEQHAFNVPLSDSIGARRALPDTRHALCRNRTGRADSVTRAPLPTVSVVICFHNEAASALERSVTSVLDRSPSHLLVQVILVDDASWLNVSESISERVNRMPATVSMIRSDSRLGLIRARLWGAGHAIGDVLVFLDSHIEVNIDWLTPLVELVASNRKTIAVPIVDVINPNTFNYTASPLVRGTFNWDLHFKWDSIPREYFDTPERYVLPIDTPTMSGGLFAVNRQFFYDFGSYDSGMDVWGAENLELSFRTWMCGGRLQIVPCSRVGHVFRQRRPYSVPDGMLNSVQNALRVVHVWLDDYSRYFFQNNPDTERLSYGDISERLRLRATLNCSSFDWYVKNVHPSLQLPILASGKQQSRNRSLGVIRLQLYGSQLCVQPIASSTSGRQLRGVGLQLAECGSSSSQLMSVTAGQQLLVQRRVCVQAEGLSVSLQVCVSADRAEENGQRWQYSSHRRTAVYSLTAGLCLAVDHVVAGATVVMDVCDERDTVVWNLIPAVD